MTQTQSHKIVKTGSQNIIKIENQTSITSKNNNGKIEVLLKTILETINNKIMTTENHFTVINTITMVKLITAITEVAIKMTIATANKCSLIATNQGMKITSIEKCGTITVDIRMINLHPGKTSGMITMTADINNKGIMKTVITTTIDLTGIPEMITINSSVQ
jgi:hypothetical protein